MDVKDRTLEPKRAVWTPPTLRAMGTIGEVLQGGGGKHSIIASDSGDENKPKGQG